MCVCMNNWTRFACCGSGPPDCSKTYGKSLIPRSKALKPKEYQCFGAGWTCVWTKNRTRFVVAGVTLQILPKPTGRYRFRALRLQDLRNTNASELNGCAYEEQLKKVCMFQVWPSRLFQNLCWNVSRSDVLNTWTELNWTEQGLHQGPFRFLGKQSTWWSRGLVGPVACRSCCLWLGCL